MYPSENDVQIETRNVEGAKVTHVSLLSVSIHVLLHSRLKQMLCSALSL